MPAMLNLYSAPQGLKEKFDYNKVLKALKKGPHFKSTRSDWGSSDDLLFRRLRLLLCDALETHVPPSSLLQTSAATATWSRTSSLERSSSCRAISAGTSQSSSSRWVRASSSGSC